MDVRTWGGDVGAQVAELSRPEASRLERANQVEDPGERLAALAALADELTMERAQEEGVLDRRGRARHSLRPNEVAHRYAGIRAAVFAGQEETEAAAQAAMLQAHVPAALQTHRSRVESQPAVLAHAEELVRSAGLSAREMSRLLNIVQQELSVPERPEGAESDLSPHVPDRRPPVPLPNDIDVEVRP